MSDLWGEVAQRRSGYREVPSIIAGSKNDTLNKKVFDKFYEISFGFFCRFLKQQLMRGLPD